VNVRALLSSPPLTGLIVMLAVVAGYIAASGPFINAQESPWPTPPPGIPFDPPSQDDPVTISAARPGSTTKVVFQQWPGIIPLIPPVPQTNLLFDGTDGRPPVTLSVDAGTVARTLQVRFTPLDVQDLPAPHWGATILRAFRLEAFDASARVLALQPARPVKLTLPVGGLIAQGVAGDRLLVAFLDEDTGQWHPLVTAYDSGRQEVLARLLAFDTLALLQE
jgi:hypothetical protein